MRNPLTYLPTLLVICALSIIPARAAVVWSQDFQSMTAGSAPSGTGITVSSNNANRRVLVESDATTPADPFGPIGNKSLMIEKINSGAASVPTIDFALPKTTAGVLTFDAYSFQSSPTWNTPLLSIYLLDGTNIGIFTSISLTNTSVFTPSASTVTDSYLLNSVNKVKIEFFANQTYSVTINGNLLNFPSVGAVIPYYSASAFSLDDLRIGSVDTALTGSRVFVDNLVLSSVPEPSNIALLGLAGPVAVLLIRRSRTA